METQKRQHNDDTRTIKCLPCKPVFKELMDNWTHSFIIIVFTVKIFVNNNNKSQLDSVQTRNKSSRLFYAFCCICFSI